MREYAVQKMEIQFDRYNRLKKWLPFIELCKDKEIIRKSRKLDFVRKIIERSVQMGNFRRAFLYVAMFEKNLEGIEIHIDTIKVNLTDILLENIPPGKEE